ncbi:MAG TPA: alkaline phosphatase D family protein [Lacipirellulaceae bacterium]|nr:alkaline phosphatase D family protein [Lacipirellulaceae bacterium]
MLDLSKLNEAVRYEGGVSRRLFLAYAASLSAVPWLGRNVSASPVKARFPNDPFRLGVASGDPTASGVVLWTRLAPEPLEPTGGMEPHKVNIAWEIAADDAMRRVVKRGTAIAAPELAHSVHVEVDNLEPGRWYWYRFRAGDAESPIGRTRTMPADDARTSELRMAFASCQHYEAGYYTAYEHMAKEEVDLVIHLGDYIYEYASKHGQVRVHAGGQCKTLDDYRVRHSQYKSDSLLQGMHARCPWMVTWDDHDVRNDYTNDRDQKEGENDPAKFLIRRAAAYQAYYENLPLRHTSAPHGPNMQIYRKQSFGRLAEIFMLDGRQYRTPQPNRDKGSDINDAARSPRNTMLGRQQFGWLRDSLGSSEATWNVLANQVIMATIDRELGPKRKFPMDDWSGYVHERNELMKFVEKRQVANLVVITGDNHANWVNDLRTDDLRVESPIVATEFVGTSITSGGNGGDGRDRAAGYMAENPGVRFFNHQRGYVRCTITPSEWRSDFRVVPDITKPGAAAVTRASFVVEAGRAGAKRA